MGGTDLEIVVGAGAEGGEMRADYEVTSTEEGIVVEVSATYTGDWRFTLNARATVRPDGMVFVGGVAEYRNGSDEFVLHVDGVVGNEGPKLRIQTTGKIPEAGIDMCATRLVPTLRRARDTVMERARAAARAAAQVAPPEEVTIFSVVDQDIPPDIAPPPQAKPEFVLTATGMQPVTWRIPSAQS